MRAVIVFYESRVAIFVYVCICVAECQQKVISRSIANNFISRISIVFLNLQEARILFNYFINHTSPLSYQREKL